MGRQDCPSTVGRLGRAETSLGGSPPRAARRDWALPGKAPPELKGRFLEDRPTPQAEGPHSGEGRQQLEERCAPREQGKEKGLSQQRPAWPTWPCLSMKAVRENGQWVGSLGN